MSPLTASTFTVANPGTQTAGTAFNETITAKDAYGNVATGYTGSQSVVFTGPANSPSGTAPTYPATVNFASGVGTASITLVDAQSTTLTATQGSITGISGSFTVSPAAASTFTVPTPGAQTAGTAFNETITAKDAYGNVATGYTGNQSITFTGPANSPGSNNPIYPATVNFASGVGTASITLVDAQSTTLTATQGSITGTSGSFTVAFGALNHFGVGAPATATAGTAVSGITLTAEDLYNNTVTSYANGNHTIAWSGATTSPGGNAPVYPVTTVSFTNGVSTTALSATLYAAGANTLTVSSTLPTVSGSNTITVNVAAASTFTVPTPGAQTAGTAFNETITAKDAYGNVATGYTGSQSVVFTGPANSPSGTAPTYPATVNFASGVGTASITLVDAQSTTLTATQGSITGTSGSFTVSPAAASTFTVPTPGAQTAGTAFNETITAKDAYGNVATGYTGNQSITFTGPANSPGSNNPIYPATVNFASGVGTASITLVDAQSTTLTATQGSITGTSGSFTVAFGALNHFGVGAPATATAGTAVSGITLTAEDLYNNTVTSYANGNHTIAWSGATTSPGGNAPVYPVTTVSFTNGVSTTALSATLYAAGANTLTASSTLPTVSGSTPSP